MFLPHESFVKVRGGGQIQVVREDHQANLSPETKQGDISPFRS